MFKHIFLAILLISSQNIGCSSTTQSQYALELDEYKKTEDGAFAFDKNIAHSVRIVTDNIKSDKKPSLLSRIFNLYSSPSRGALITKKSMPKLYSYIEGLCVENKIAIPDIFISHNRDVFNAFAWKLLDKQRRHFDWTRAHL